MNISYYFVYVVTLLASICKAILCFLTMLGFLGIEKASWFGVLTFETAILAGFVVGYDQRIPKKSHQHNVYRTYTISLLAMVLTVWIFMLLAIYGLVKPQIALMTYLFFCLPIWLTLAVSFFELQKTFREKQ